MRDRSLDGPTSMPTWIDVAGFFLAMGFVFWMLVEVHW